MKKRAGMILLLPLLFWIIVFSAFAMAQEGAESGGFKPMPAGQFRDALAECKSFEDSVRGPMCSFTGKEFDSPNGDPAIEEKNRDFEEKWFKCMELSFHADELYKNGEITEQEYRDGTGQGEEYSFGSLGSFGMTQCFYVNCKLVVKYYLDSANAETNLARKAELYGKAVDNYFKCMKTAMSDVVHPAAFDSSLGKLGEQDDQLNEDASAAYLGICDTKIRIIKERIAAETDPQRKQELYDELQEEVLRCASMGMSALVDPGSSFAGKLDIFNGYENDDENTYRNVYIDAAKKKCEIRLEEARKKVEAAGTPEEKAKAMDEFAEVFFECYMEPYDSVIMNPWELDPFNYAELSQDELDSVIRSCSEKIRFLEGEKAKPVGMREGKRDNRDIELLLGALRRECGLPESEELPATADAATAGYRSSGIEGIIRLAPDRFSENAGMYVALPGDIVNIRYIDTAAGTGTGIFTASSPSPTAIIMLTGNAAARIGDAIDDISITITDIDNSISPVVRDVVGVKVTSPADDVCEENWSCTEWGQWGDWSRCSSGQQLRSHARKCADKNRCGTIVSKPKTSETEKKACGGAEAGSSADQNSVTDANAACTGNWSCGGWGDWGACSNGMQTRARECTDSMNCGTTGSGPALSESRNCGDIVSCTESWSCGEYGAWGEWGACSEAGSQSRTRARECTDASSCGTASGRPAATQDESRACDYTPTEQKPEYTSHSGALGANVGELPYNNGSAQFNTANTGGQYGYRVLGIPSHATVKICLAMSSGSIGYNAYPQYHYGYDWSTAEWEAANPGCITAYNKNAWANGMLVHIGDPNTANAAGTITVTQIS